MNQSRAPYPAAFYQQIIALVQAGKSAKELSKEFGCCTKTILNIDGARYLGKGYGLICRHRREDVRPVFEFVMASQAEFPVQALCRILNVSRSAYYDWRKCVPSVRKQENAQLIEDIRMIHAELDLTSGMPRIRTELKEQGWTVRNVIHHSDQECLAFGMRVRPSMGSVGDAYDNAMAERMYSILPCVHTG